MRGAVALALVLALGAGWSGAVLAHPGGLDASGCHTDRRTGTRHCHRPASAGQAVTPQILPQPPASGRAWRNCTEARAAGAAPVRRGDPGYGPHLDRDNDGIGCE